jgi:hypothetical protein
MAFLAACGLIGADIAIAPRHRKRSIPLRRQETQLEPGSGARRPIHACTSRGVGIRSAALALVLESLTSLGLVSGTETRLRSENSGGNDVEGRSVPCRNQCLLVDGDDADSADIGLVDLDGLPKGHWQSYRDRFPGRPTVVISLQAVDTKDSVFLQKPLKADQLLSALQALRTVVAGQPSPQAARGEAPSVAREAEPTSSGQEPAAGAAAQQEATHRKPTPSALHLHLY